MQSGRQLMADAEGIAPTQVNVSVRAQECFLRLRVVVVVLLVRVEVEAVLATGLGRKLQWQKEPDARQTRR